MARNRIEELLVELKFQGGEELKRISSGFRELARATALTDPQIESARRKINDYAKSLNNSEQALRGQIQALQNLRAQATVGGNIYAQLSNDVTRLSKTLKGLEEDYKAVGRAAEQTDRQIANQFPARRPEAFRVQLAALRRELDGISVSAKQYGDKLTEITIREAAFGRAQARQGVIAGAQAVGAPLIGAMTPEQPLPNTTAALRLQLTELQQDLGNAERSGSNYTKILLEINKIQRELASTLTGTASAYDRLAAAETAAIRRAEKLRSVQEYYRTTGARTGFRDPGTGAIIAGGTTGDIIPGRSNSGVSTVKPPSELFRSIGAIIDQPGANAAQLMERTYEEVAQQIRSAAAASDGSIRSLQRQRDAWQNLRVTISPLSADYKRISQEADRAIQSIDRQMQRMQGRRRISAIEATQAAGAVISGGIFGGPEGFLGGLGGAALGAAVPGLGVVGGAFAGAAGGAQLGMIRRSLGEMATLTAEIDRQQIALRNVIGSQAEYESGLQFIDATSRRLAIPQDQLTRQFTQLAASVLGAGGNVDAAKVSFRGIADGIRGTGGSLADLDGALRATSQVFSKGKVSAEELRQQIGERLAGAFSTFAVATGRTVQGLDKDLEKGEVTLNDFVAFVQFLSKRYGDSATEIAASSKAAGDRIQTTFTQLRIAVGRELQPVGAQLQDAFSKFLVDAAPLFVLAAKGISTAIEGMYAAISGGFNLLKQLSGLIQNLSRVMLVFGGISAGIFVASNITTFVGALKNLYGIMRTLLSIQRLLLAVESARAAMQAIIAGLTTGATKGRIVGAIVGGVGGLGAAIGIGKLVEGIVKQVTESIDSNVKDFGKIELPTFPQPEVDRKTNKTEDKARKSLFNELLDQLNAQNEILAKQGRLNESLAVSEMDKANVAKSTAEQILANEQAQLDLRLKYGEVSRDVYQRQQQAIRLEGQIIRDEFTKTTKKLEEEAQALVDEVIAPGGIAGPALSPFQAQFDEVSKIIQKNLKAAARIGGEPGRAVALELDKVDVSKVATQRLLAGDFTSLAQQIQDLKNAGKELSTLDLLKQKYLQDWDSLDPVLRGQLETMAAQVDTLKKQREAMEQLNSVATAIGDAFGNAFKSVITGAATAKEALASFFSSVADYFADMAAKMIAEWIKLALLNTIVKIFNPAAGAGLSDLSAPATINNPLGVLNANGNAFAQNGIVPYARGGIVNSPMLFKFARGGTMQTGVMGEAGPEAIMPLKRGADGRLGVAASGGGGVNVTVNVDAKGTQVQGDSGQGAQLARVVAGAVQAEIVKQQRPGGLLASTR